MDPPPDPHAHNYSDLADEALARRALGDVLEWTNARAPALAQAGRPMESEIRRYETMRRAMSALNNSSRLGNDVARRMIPIIDPALMNRMRYTENNIGGPYDRYEEIRQQLGWALDDFQEPRIFPVTGPTPSQMRLRRIMFDNEMAQFDPEPNRPNQLDPR